MKDPILQTGNPVLREVAKPVDKKDIGSRKLTALINKMKKVLSKEKYGVALAAPQMGEPLRLFIIAGRIFLPEDAPENAEVPPHLVFINPELVRTSHKKTEVSEGCLSVRGKYGAVERFEKATVKALDEKGKPFIHHGSGLLAQIFQHELDHLEGILFIDKATKLDDWKEKEE
ncbi:MAG: peptide deformylase [Candidatus Adlerbacteria bacterium]|nr:peptide deformylase [Candidatus Adlerbacteria bacterium]MDZ4226324.1 peptide deformylase [Patescibacteria group bacterium]